MISYAVKSKLGLEAEAVFCEWMNTYNIDYRKATIEEQHKGIDIVAKKTYEVKHQSFPDKLIIEEKSMDDVPGWIYTSEANFLIEVSADRKKYLKIDMKQLRDVFIKIKENYELHNNDGMSQGMFGDIWLSSFYIIPVNQIEQYVKIEEVVII